MIFKRKRTTTDFFNYFWKNIKISLSLFLLSFTTNYLCQIKKHKCGFDFIKIILHVLHETFPKLRTLYTIHCIDCCCIYTSSIQIKIHTQFYYENKFTKINTKENFNFQVELFETVLPPHVLCKFQPNFFTV